MFPILQNPGNWLDGVCIPLLYKPHQVNYQGLPLSHLCPMNPIDMAGWVRDWQWLAHLARQTAVKACKLAY